MTGRLAEAWRRYWFAPLEANPLPALRIIYVGLWLALWSRWVLRDFARLSAFPPDFYHRSLALRALPLPLPAGPALVQAVGVATLASGALAAVGLFTRPALAAFTLCFLYIFGTDSSWGTVAHQPAFMIWALVALTFAPGVDAWSLDRWLARRRGKPAPARPTAWGAKLIFMLLCCHYLHSSVSKLRYGGFEWGDGHTLTYYGTARWNTDLSAGSEGSTDFVQAFGGPAEPAPARAWRDGFGVEYYYHKSHPSALVGRLSASQPLMAAGSIAVLLFELFFPFALFGPRLRALFCGAAPFFHVGALLTVGAFFDYFVWTCLAFFPWSLWRRRGRAAAAPDDAPRASGAEAL